MLWWCRNCNKSLGETYILLYQRSLFWNKCTSNVKTGTILLFKCGVCRDVVVTETPLIHLQVVTVEAARTGSPSFLLYSTQNDDWGSPPGNVQGHMRRTIRHEHFDSPPFLLASSPFSQPKVLQSPAECCCDIAHIKIMSSPLHSGCPLGLMYSWKRKVCHPFKPHSHYQYFQLACLIISHKKLLCLKV